MHLTSSPCFSAREIPATCSEQEGLPSLIRVIDRSLIMADDHRLIDKFPNMVSLTFHVLLVYVGRRVSTGEAEQYQQHRQDVGTHCNPIVEVHFGP